MKTQFLAIGASVIALAVALPAFAQTTDQTTTTVVTKRPNTGTGVGATGGAVAGAVVAGPVGAVVGGVAGAVAGHKTDAPVEVTTYVRTQHVDAVSYDGPITVGAVLPSTVTVYEVPRYDRYRWTYINGQRLLIDNDTHRIVSVINDN